MTETMTTNMAVERGPITHEVKCWPEPFAAVRSRLKPWELRKNDRDYRVGDTLRQFEWSPDDCAYTGETDEQEIIWALYGPAFGLPEGYVIMTLSPPVSPAEQNRSQVFEEGARFQAGEEVGSVPESSGEVPHCNACGRSSRYWHAENRLWNLVMGGPDAKGDPGGILCPNCFIDRAAASGMARRWVVTDVDPDECAKQPSHEERERVARIIDPAAFSDRYAPVLPSRHEKWLTAKYKRIQVAVGKADAILAGNGGQDQ